MTKLVFSHDPVTLPQRQPDLLPVLLYGTTAQSPSRFTIGHQLLDRVPRLGVQVSQTAFDLLTVSMAVTAADTFVLRDNAEDGWARDIELDIPVFEPAKWTAVKDDLEAALNFLSGDLWRVNILPGGRMVPSPHSRTGRWKMIDIRTADCVCLFSGGLDSTAGVLDLIERQGRNPLLVSHSYRGDKEKQEWINKRLPNVPARFAACADPRSPEVKDVSMRTRSFNFLAYGAVAASAIGTTAASAVVDLFVPENGLISLNAPLTRRRIGALSTRTTHPHFIALIARIFSGLGLGVHISNPYAFKTKGEMLRGCATPQVRDQIASATVSCGKWKRKNEQCGRCVPCLIRRASFHAAGIPDRTPYRFPVLGDVLRNEDERDDLLAMMLAAKKVTETHLEPWLMQSGPLPDDAAARSEYLGVFRRGMDEVADYLRNESLIF